MPTASVSKVAIYSVVFLAAFAAAGAVGFVAGRVSPATPTVATPAPEAPTPEAAPAPAPTPVVQATTPATPIGTIAQALQSGAENPAANPAATPATTPVSPVSPLTDSPESPLDALRRIQSAKLIINVHEHASGPEVLPDLLKMMDENGMRQTLLVGSSTFTLTLRESVGFTGYDENNEKLLAIAKENPERFEAWPTVNPLDPDKVDKLKDMHQRGAKGIKLYLGHGYVRRDNGNYMFHVMAMDDPSMFPFYQYCADHHIPLLFHVNPFLKGFSEELIHVLESFPDLKVNCPHFMLSSIREQRLIEFLSTFPNLYSDISFGHDDFLKAGIQRISRSPAKFQRLFTQFPDRFFFGTDLVLTSYESKSVPWMNIRTQAYYDMLTQATYTTELLPGQTLFGLQLGAPLLDNILYKNYERFRDLKPRGTKITREVNWSALGVEKTGRVPGQVFPPAPRRGPGG